MDYLDMYETLKKHHNQIRLLEPNIGKYTKEILILKNHRKYSLFNLSCVTSAEAFPL